MFRSALVFAAAMSLALGSQAKVWGQGSGSPTSNSSGGGRTAVGGGNSLGSSSLGRTGSSSFGSGMGSTGSSLSRGTQLGASAQQMLRDASRAGYFVGGDAALAGFSAYASGTAANRGSSYSSYGGGYGSSPYGSSPYGSSAYRSGGYGQGMYGTRRSSSGRYSSQYGMSNSMNQQEVRTALAVGFEQAPANALQVSSRVAARLEKAATRIQFQSAPQVSVQDGTATLRGVVATEHDRVLAEQLVRLEAGISRVKNELTLPPPASPSPAPGNPSSTAKPPLVPSPPAAAK